MLFESLMLKCSWLVILIFPCLPVIGQSDHGHLPSSIFFKIRERDAHIESIAYDSGSRIFYLGSIHKHKIIQRKPDGSVSDFKTEGQDSLYSVLGLRVDPIRHWLWACTSPLAEMEGFNPQEKVTARILLYEIPGGKLLKSYSFPFSGTRYVIGEPVVSKEGEVYITDSGQPNIYRIGKSDSLELYLNTGLRSLQGITFSGDEKYILFSDYASGIYRCDRKDKTVQRIETPAEINTKGIDGLYFYNQQLIATQNGTPVSSILRLTLNEDCSRITGSKIIETNNPLYNELTLGVIAGNNFYFVANSQWKGYNSNKQILPNNLLQDILICKISLLSSRNDK